MESDINQSDTSVNLIVTEDQKFQTILGSLNGFEEFVLDVNGRIISSNLEAVTITGYEEWEVIGKLFSIFYTPEDQLLDKMNEDLSRVKKRLNYVCSGFKVKKKGTKFWAKVKISCLFDEHEKVAGFRVVLQDSTHRAMYSLSTKRIKDEYLYLLNNPFVGIVKFKLKDNACLLLNDKAKEMLDRSSVQDLFLPDIFYDQEEFQRFRTEINQSKRVDNFEFRIKNSGTTPSYGSISCKVFPTGGFIEGVVTNTTEKRQRIADLEYLNNELDNFIYRASHDLRAPLTTVMGLINLIEHENSIKLIKEYSSKIEDRILHLDSLLRDLSKVAFNNSHPIEIQVIVLDELISEILKPYKNKFPNLDIQVQCDSKWIFQGDRERINTILTNIISNAFKFQNPHQPKPFVRVRMECFESELHVTIQDNGIGISKNYLNDIFKLFFKAVSIGSGSGLGLYVVKEMVEKMNGRISVESELDKGTTVRIFIPIEVIAKSHLIRTNQLMSIL